MGEVPLYQYGRRRFRGTEQACLENHTPALILIAARKFHARLVKRTGVPRSSEPPTLAHNSCYDSRQHFAGSKKSAFWLNYGYDPRK